MNGPPVIHLTERLYPFRGPDPYGLACACGLSMIEAFPTYIEAARFAYEHERQHRINGESKRTAARVSAR